MNKTLNLLLKPFKKLQSLLFLKFSGRPKVFWWSIVHQHGLTYENFGDLITPFVVEKLTGKAPILFDPSNKLSRYLKHSIMTGSIINKARKNTMVWGSGIIRKDQHVENASFYAVRGPRTYQKLKSLGYSLPEVFGDPGLLLSRLYHKQKKDPKHEVGLISHYVDHDDMKEIVQAQGIKHIDLRTLSVESVIDQVVECKKIISTSLHGLIVAHSYGIPALWWKFSNKLSGDDVKFYDYFESVGIKDVQNHEGRSLTALMQHGQFTLPESKILDDLCDGLIRSFPHKLTTKQQRIN